VGTLMSEGFCQIWGGASKAPYDFIGDSLRGTRGMLMDLFRAPEKVIEACNRLAPLMVRWTVRHATNDTIPGIFIPLHKGADGFMSLDQFKQFYWPSLRAVLLGLIEEGFTPFLYAEGKYGSRLETIMDLPKGKTVWLFDQTDMERAKETIGQVACIQGNLPLSLAHAGTVEQVSDYVKHLIDVAGPGGGYVMDLGGVTDSAKDENIAAMINVTKEYGVY
jgi:uroporphyrinogen-III decarboxylase